MEDWTEETLFKLPVKELKSLARKSKVNPNFKKAELVQALLTNVKHISDESGSSSDQQPKRMTRSRVSMWQTAEETATNVKNISGEENLNLDTAVKVSVKDKRTKRRKVKEAEDVDSYDTSEMFPLVSTIQLASKPLVEITNKNVVRQEVKLEVQTDPTAKRSKRSRGLEKNVEVRLSFNNTDLNKEAPKVTVLTPDRIDDQEVTKLSSSFVVEGEKSSSKDVERTKNHKPLVEKLQSNGKQNLNKSKQLDEQILTNCNNNKIEASSENDLITNEKKGTKKSKRGRKRKSQSPLDDDTKSGNASIQQQSADSCNLEANLQSRCKKRRKNVTKDDQESEIESSTGNETTIKNTKSPRNQNPDLLNNCKKDQVIQPVENNIVCSTEANALKKSARGGKNKQHLHTFIEEESSKIQEETESIEVSNNCSSSQRKSRRSKSLSTSQNESAVVNSNCNGSLARRSSMSSNTSKKDISFNKDTSTIEGETGGESIQGPTRSSTFILSNSADQETDEMPVPAPLRNATFILSGGKSPQRKSFKFSSKLTSGKMTAESKNIEKPVKSIGLRIMQNSTLKQRVDKSCKKQGSTLKKTTQTKSTPGSVFKKRPVSKMPDFKKIHQQLFKNMESLSENKKRQQTRAQVLLQSPVPRCALLSPKQNSRNTDRSPMTRVAPSPLAAKLRTPVASCTSTTGNRPITAVSRTPTASSVNRFGFRKPVKKEEALNIVGKKLPVVNMVTKKEEQKKEGRNMLKGVRTNKRFMLLMQMRNMGVDSPN
ncbi:MATH and LRR domain-containing protein PFE0570w-like [Macrosteles quadrilineatus]|uniref:MATH and LRR domain-containing protein PFE0570w-like n=1 Tax=Macrosteles quadrilineatus TaxID=74068 RepID=UPI0023E232B7|nr:MATH and LRR domain-containing protein PFE0570w-like [Macrosteles quadrilineatus]